MFVSGKCGRLKSILLGCFFVAKESPLALLSSTRYRVYPPAMEVVIMYEIIVDEEFKGLLPVLDAETYRLLGEYTGERLQGSVGRLE